MHQQATEKERERKEEGEKNKEQNFLDRSFIGGSHYILFPYIP